MDLLADRGRRVPIEELNTSRLLAHARKQAHERNLDDMLIADVDSTTTRTSASTSFCPSSRTTCCATSCWPAAPRGGRR